MKVKLKTLEQLEKEFRPYASMWEFINGSLRLRVDGFHWHINSCMIKRLGGFIDVMDIGYSNTRNYTHYGDDQWYYHKLWFAPKFDDFISEEEMKI
jgi:hypothetical protein